MKLSLNWLRRYLDHGLTPEDLSWRLTMAGMEVEQSEIKGNDIVFEIEVTPNRPDCLNITGLAREVSAIADRDLSLPETGDYDDAGQIDIIIDSPADCARYIGTLIEGISLRPFDSQMSGLLNSVGVNPISNVVDATNFVLFETGQPLHAFDYDRLAGGRVHVRRAHRAEKIVTLDNVERTLDETILVIADEEKPVAIAGIMGGRDSAVTESTRRILLESAYFDMGLIRRASRKLALTSDSSYRFERGVAYRTVESAAARAVDILLEQTGGRVSARRDVQARIPQSKRQEVTVTLTDIRSLLGADLNLDKATRILKRLGCIVVPGEGKLIVVPPHFRQDITITEDVIEEIARINGYDNLPMSLPQVPAVNIPALAQSESFNFQLAEQMSAQGFNELVTFSLVGGAALSKARYEGEFIRLQNPMSAEQEQMRPTLLPAFLTVAATNINSGQKDLRLFEIGKRYLPDSERWTLAALVSGKHPGDWRTAGRRALDLFDLKGAVEQALMRLRVRDVSFKPVQDAAFIDGQAAGILIDGVACGRMGCVAEEVAGAFDIKRQLVFFTEVDLEVAESHRAGRERFSALPVFPAIVRDVSLAVPEGVIFDDLRRACVRHGQDLLRGVMFTELYTGDKLVSGCKGYVFSLIYRSDERTLTDQEVGDLHEKIIAALIAEFAVARR